MKLFCPANWRQSADELRFVVEDLTPRVVVWEPSEATTAVHGALAAEGWVRAGDDYEALVAGGSPREFPQVADTEPVLALYTAAFDGRPNAALLSSAAFGLLHYPYGGWGSVGPTALCGLMFALAVIRGGSLAGATLGHALFNLTNIVILLLNPEAPV